MELDPVGWFFIGDEPLAIAEIGFFVAKAHNAALDVLAALSAGHLNLAVLTGIKGTGKTALIGHWLEERPGGATTTRISADGRRPDAFLSQIAHRLQIDVRSHDAKDAIAHWRAALAAAYPTGRAAILIIDNAERLDPETVKVLAAIQMSGNAGLSMLIAGRPEITARFEPAQMSRPGLNSGQVVLRNFDLAETKDFLGFLGQSPEKAVALHAATAGNPGRIVDMIVDRTDEPTKLRTALGPVPEVAMRPRVRLFETAAERKKRTSLPAFDSENPREFFRWGFGIADNEVIEGDETVRRHSPIGREEILEIGPQSERDLDKQPGVRAPPLVATSPVMPITPAALTDAGAKDRGSVLRAVPDKPRLVAPFQHPAGTIEPQDSAMLREIFPDGHATKRRNPGRWLVFLTVGAVALSAATLLSWLAGETGDTRLAAAPQAATEAASGIIATDPPDAAGVSVSTASPERMVELAAPDILAATATADPLPRRDLAAAVPADANVLAPSSGSDDATLQSAPQVTISAKSGIFAPNLPTSANARLPVVVPEQIVALVAPEKLTEFNRADPAPPRQADADIRPSDLFSAERTGNSGYEATFAVELSDPEPHLPAPTAVSTVNLASALVVGEPQPADDVYVVAASDPTARTTALAELEQAAISTPSTTSEAATSPPTNPLRIDITPVPRDRALVDSALDAAPGLGKLAEGERADLARMLADGTCVDQALREVTGAVNRHTLAALLHQMNLCSGE